eukprot:s1402_g12.t1
MQVSIPTLVLLVAKTAKEFIKISYKLVLAQGGVFFKMIYFVNPNFIFGADYGVYKALWGVHGLGFIKLYGLRKSDGLFFTVDFCDLARNGVVQYLYRRCSGQFDICEDFVGAGNSVGPRVGLHVTDQGMFKYSEAGFKCGQDFINLPGLGGSHGSVSGEAFIFVGQCVHHF